MTEKLNPLTLDKQLCFAIYAAGHAFTRFYKPRLEALDLTYPQYLVFLVLWEEDGLTVKALGEKLYLDSGTITPLVKRLEARGLLVRKRDEDDERMVRVQLTPEGQAMREKALAIPLAIAGASGLDQAGFEHLKSELDTLRERLGAS